MSQGYAKDKPAYLDALESSPMRLNLNAVATCHRGATPPTDPDEGWFWLDISDALNYRLRQYLFGSWVILLNNLLGGFPTQGGASVVTHTQAVASGTWTIVHNLNSLHVQAQFFDSTSAPKNQIIPSNVEVTNVNTITATFTPTQAGTATITG